ncbi:MAG: hypothetical protein IT222_03990 [Crocinitomix sp.]|nr:hypothetical protein [Crocinitomix sp.]
MAEKAKVDELKIQGLLNDLSENDPAKLVSTIQSLKIHGNENTIEPLLLLLSKNPVNEVRKEIIDLLNTTKSTKVPEKIAKALSDPRFIALRHDLLVSIWSSGLDYRPYLREIVIAGTEGEMMDALECLSIVESVEEEFSENQLFDALLVLTEYLRNNKDVKDAKMDLLRELTQELQSRNNLL